MATFNDLGKFRNSLASINPQKPNYDLNQMPLPNINFILCLMQSILKKGIIMIMNNRLISFSYLFALCMVAASSCSPQNSIANKAEEAYDKSISFEGHYVESGKLYGRLRSTYSLSKICYDAYLYDKKGAYLEYSQSIVECDIKAGSQGAFEIKTKKTAPSSVGYIQFEMNWGSTYDKTNSDKIIENKKLACAFWTAEGDLCSWQTVNYGQKPRVVNATSQYNYYPYSGWATTANADSVNYNYEPLIRNTNLYPVVTFNQTAYRNAISDTSFSSACLMVEASFYNKIWFIETEETIQQGSGTIYRKSGNTYYVLTAEHVIHDNNNYENSRFRVKTIYGETIDCTVRITFPSVDLAILSFNSNSSFNVVPLAQTTDLPYQMNRIAAVGCPSGNMNTISIGKIKTISDATAIVTGKTIKSLILSTNMIEGASGGGVFDYKKELIGVIWGAGKDHNAAVPVETIQDYLSRFGSLL